MTTITGRRSLSWAEYAAELAKCGARILPGTNGDYWMKHESLGIIRLNDYDLPPPVPGEVREVLKRWPAAVASYTMRPDENHPANAWWYVCTDRSYALDKLSHTMRKNVRRGFKELKIEFISPDQFLSHGVEPFCDSRHRNGLSDGTEKEFYSRFGARARCPGHVILGAWKDNKLAAFLFITLVEDWVINEGPFGANEFLHYRSNDALLFWELSHSLPEGTCRGVSAGLSSVQLDAVESGLHVFKKKAGFEARAVHRAIILHPFLRPLANRITLWAMNTALRFRPADRRLLKAIGVLSELLKEKRGFNTKK